MKEILFEYIFPPILTFIVVITAFFLFSYLLLNYNTFPYTCISSFWSIIQLVMFVSIQCLTIVNYTLHKLKINKKVNVNEINDNEVHDEFYIKMLIVNIMGMKILSLITSIFRCENIYNILIQFKEDNKIDIEKVYLSDKVLNNKESVFKDSNNNNKKTKSFKWNTYYTFLLYCSCMFVFYITHMFQTPKYDFFKYYFISAANTEHSHITTGHIIYTIINFILLSIYVYKFSLIKSEKMNIDTFLVSFELITIFMIHYIEIIFPIIYTLSKAQLTEFGLVYLDSCCNILRMFVFVVATIIRYHIKLGNDANNYLLSFTNFMKQNNNRKVYKKYLKGKYPQKAVVLSMWNAIFKYKLLFIQEIRMRNVEDIKTRREKIINKYFNEEHYDNSVLPVEIIEHTENYIKNNDCQNNIMKCEEMFDKAFSYASRELKMIFDKIYKKNKEEMKKVERNAFFNDILY